MGGGICVPVRIWARAAALHGVAPGHTASWKYTFDLLQGFSKIEWHRRLHCMSSQEGAPLLLLSARGSFGGILGDGGIIGCKQPGMVDLTLIWHLKRLLDAHLHEMQVHVCWQCYNRRDAH